jgi:hypothetical protein
MTPRFLLCKFALVATVFGLAACDDPTESTTSLNPTENLPLSSAKAEASLARIMDEANVALARAGREYRVVKAEYLTAPSGEDFGGTVLAKDVGNKRLPDDFVAHDVNREPWSGPVGGSNDNITYAVDQTGDAVPPLGGLTAAQTDAAIVRAMNSWDAVNCSDLSLERNDDFGIDIGVVADILGLGGSPFVVADVQHAGWRDINFAGTVLASTFTFVFVDDAGNLTDDVAFREIYYDPSFPYADNGVSNIDVESVALHEAGHGLSQNHFGKIWLTNNGELARSPFAVMNAGYTQPIRELTGSDNGGHCANWANWPNH